MAKTADRKCLDCGKVVSGRRDKKFCDDLCRNAYNNKRVAAAASEMRTINLILKKNRGILETLIPQEGKIKVKEKILMEKGFNFNFITQTHTTQAGAVYRYCYEFAYLGLDEKYFLIVRREKSI
jgi:hypothetical protein